MGMSEVGDGGMFNWSGRMSGPLQFSGPAARQEPIIRRPELGRLFRSQPQCSTSDGLGDDQSLRKIQLHSLVVAHNAAQGRGPVPSVRLLLIDMHGTHVRLKECVGLRHTTTGTIIRLKALEITLSGRA